MSGALALALLVGCGAPAPPCPPGLRADAEREARLRAALAEVPEGRALMDRVEGPLRVCFGHPGPGVLDEEGVLRLSGAAPPAVEAARLGHLLRHVLEGPPLPAGPAAGQSCDVLVAIAMTEESAAHDLERRLRAALGVAAPLDPDLEALEADYRGRCQAKRG